MKKEAQQLELLSLKLKVLKEWRLAEEVNFHLRKKANEETCNDAQSPPRAAKRYQVMVRCGASGELLSVWQGIIAETKVEAVYKARQTPEFKRIMKGISAFIFDAKELGELAEGAKKEPKVLSPAQWVGGKWPSN